MRYSAHQLGADRAELEALPDHGCGHTEPRCDILGAHAFLAMQLGKSLVLVGGVHVGTDRVLGENDFGRVVLGVEDAADRLVGLDLLALDAEQLREAAAFSGIDQIVAGRLALWPDLRLDDRILQHAEGGDAGGERLDVRLGVRDLPHVLGRLLQAIERNKHNVLAARVLVLRLLMVSLLWLRGSAQTPRMNPCPSARPGEGEQEENRRGYLSARSGSERSERRSGDADFVLAGGARAEPSHPRPTKERCRAATHYSCARDGSRMAETRNPAPRDLKGLGSRQPGPARPDARKSHV